MDKKLPVLAYLVQSLLGEYHLTQLLAIKQLAFERGFSLVVLTPFLFYSQKDHRQEYLQTFNLFDPDLFDGVIVSGASLSYFFSQASLSKLFSKLSQKPLAIISENLGYGRQIRPDNFKAFYELTEHLIVHHQYNSFAFVRGLPNNADAREREAAFTACMDKYHIAPQKIVYIDGDFGTKSGQSAVLELLAKSPPYPRALVCANDDMACGAIAELTKQGYRVPEDFAVVGFDDAAEADSDIQLTTVSQDIGRQIEEAVTYVLAKIRGDESLDGDSFTPQLVIRQSCGCPRSEATKEPSRDRLLQQAAKGFMQVRGYSIGELTTFSKNIMESLSLESLSHQLDVLSNSLSLKNMSVALYPGSLEGTSKNQVLPDQVQIIYRNSTEIGEQKVIMEPCHKLGIDFEKLRTQRSDRVVSEFVFQDQHFGFLSIELNKPNEFFVYMINLEICNFFHNVQLKNKMEQNLKKLMSLDILKNEFIANVAHDFRSPLTITLGTSELGMFEHSDDDENYKKYEVIYEASLKLKNSIDRFLELTKLDSQAMKLNPEEHDLEAFFRDLVKFYESSLFKTNIKIDFRVEASTIKPIMVDLDKLEQVMHNLISNAIKFVEIDRGVIALRLRAEDGLIVIEVEDNGIGIPSDKLDFIFERYSQIKDQARDRPSGTGIGLSYCKQLLALMGGVIWGESRGLGFGARFVVQIPLIRPTEGHEIKAPNKVRSPRGRDEIKTLIGAQIKNRFQFLEAHPTTNPSPDLWAKDKKILVVEDDIQINELECQIIIKEGFSQVHRAYDGKKGLDMALELVPDLIICDIDLPSLQGDQMYARLSRDPRFANTDFVFVSAVADQEARSRIRVRGNEVFLTKPIDLAALVSVLHKTLGE